MFKLTIFAFLVCVILSSCHKAHCNTASFSLGLVAFSTAESDTIILRRFDKGTNFTSEHDSLLIDTLNTPFQRYSDTTILYYRTPDGLSVFTEEYDYEIYLSKLNRVFRLTDIIYTNALGASGERQFCFAKLNSYNINGQLKNPSNDNDIIFIDK